MKNFIIRTVKMLAMYSFLGLILQGILVNILFAVTPAEGQNLRDVKVKANAVNISLEDAFQMLEQKTNFKFNYIKDELPLNEKVTVMVEDESLYNILEVFAKDYGLTFSRINDQIVVKKSQGQTENLVTTVENGTIKGKVTDAATKEPLYGASVVLKGTTLGSYTDSKGNFTIDNVKPGKYTVTASYVGYSITIKTIEVNANITVDVNFALDQSAVNLDEVTVTGSISGRNVRESANPITVIPQKQLENRNINNLLDVLQEIPGVVPGSFGYTAYANTSKGGALNSLNLRGFSPPVLGATNSAVKVLVDGVEVLNYAFLNYIDMNDIAKIEVASGPMSSTLYGAGSSSGVIQIFTKRGGGKLKVNFRTMLTSQETYIQYANPLNQEYSLSIKGGDLFGYGMGVDYTKLPGSRWGPYTSGDEKDWSYNISFNGLISNVKFDAKYVYNSSVGGSPFPQTWYKVALNDGWANPESQLASPFQRSTMNIDVHMVTLNLQQPLTDHLYHKLVAGINTSYSANHFLDPFQSGTDNLYPEFQYTNTAKNMRYFLNYKQDLSDEFSLDLTGGFDYLDQNVTNRGFYLSASYEENKMINTTKNTFYASSNYINTFIARTTGLFFEGVFGLYKSLFLTTGIRTENNTTYGDNLGWLAIPRVGLAYNFSLGNINIKPRFSWGSSTQALSAVFKLGSILANSTILPNPDLQPQSQSGYEVGTDFYYSDNLALKLTYYDQKYKNLVRRNTISRSPNVSQYINVQEAFNRGLEVGLNYIYNAFTVNISASIVSSKYGSGYLPSPYIQEGARIIEVPSGSFFIQLGYKIPALFDWSEKGGNVSVNYQYIGSERNYDGYTQAKILSETGEYTPYQYIESSGYSRVGLRIDYSVLNNCVFFVDVSNLLNNQQMLLGGFGPSMGRKTSLGFNFSY